MAYEFDYENEVTNPIVDIMRDEQVYLCEPENLPQLAKLGYMFSTLYSVGRITYGYRGNIERADSCEDNPRDFFECMSESESRNDIIYDAWAMHEHDASGRNAYNLIDNIKNGRTLLEWEKRLKNPRKTFQDWCDILMDSQYKYKISYENGVKDVCSNLFCNASNNIIDGFLCEEASGGGQVTEIYGEWENSKFRSDIQEKVYSILDKPEVVAAIDKYYEFRHSQEQERKDIKINSKHYSKFISDDADVENMSYDELDDHIHINLSKHLDIISDNIDVDEDKYICYSSFNESAPLFNFDETTHKSYIIAALDMCLDVIENAHEYTGENDYGGGNGQYMVDCAKKYVEKWKHILRNDKLNQILIGKT